MSGEGHRDPDLTRGRISAHGDRSVAAGEVGIVVTGDIVTRADPDIGDISIDLGPDGEVIELVPGDGVAVDVHLLNRTDRPQRLRLTVEKPDLRCSLLQHPTTAETSASLLLSDGTVSIEPHDNYKVRIVLEATAAEPMAGSDTLHVAAIAADSSNRILGRNWSRRVRVAKNRAVVLDIGHQQFMASESPPEAYRLPIAAQNVGNTREVVCIGAEDRSVGGGWNQPAREKWLNPQWITVNPAQLTLEPHDRGETSAIVRFPRRSFTGTTWHAGLAVMALDDSTVLGSSTVMRVRQAGRLEDLSTSIAAVGGRAVRKLHHWLKTRMGVPRYAVAIPIIGAMAVALTLATAGPQSVPSHPPPGPTQPMPTSTPPRVVRVAPVACTPGGWITQLASAPVSDRGWQDILDKVVALRSRTSRILDLKVTTTNVACERIWSRRNRYVLYMGPYRSPEDAIAVCKSFGWTSRDSYDINQCDGHAIDPSIKGRLIFPDGTRSTGF